MSKPIICIKAPPELGDGDHWCVYKPDELGSLAEMIRVTIEDECLEDGDDITLSVVAMTQEQLDALPDI